MKFNSQSSLTARRRKLGPIDEALRLLLFRVTSIPAVELTLLNGPQMPVSRRLTWKVASVLAVSSRLIKFINSRVFIISKIQPTNLARNGGCIIIKAMNSCLKNGHRPI